MLFFVEYPIVSNLILSLQDVTVTTLTAEKKPWIGFQNYVELFQDDVLKSSIINTLLFTLACLGIQFIIGMLLALFFNKKFSFAKPIRGILMMPWMIPITITALMFKFIFSSNVGILNQALQTLHIVDKPIDWLTQPHTAMFALILANIWIGIPFNMILISTGLSTISEDLYESASIDGANRKQKFFKITLPLLRPAIESVLILGFIYTFKVFDLAYGMTFIQDQTKRPITARIFNFMGQYGTKWSYLTAFAVVTIIPVAFIFIFMQKYIISGMTSGAVKG